MAKIKFLFLKGVFISLPLLFACAEVKTATDSSSTMSAEKSRSTCTQDLSMATFNLKVDAGTEDAAKDVNGWNNKSNPRSQRMKKILANLNPDILGTQEGLEHQIKDMKSFLPNHGFYGVGRSNGKAKGEFEGIFYLKSKYKFLKGGNFWLSDTPDKAGSTFSGEGHPRMATWIRVQDIASKANLLIVNSHWGLVYSAKEKSAFLMVSKVKSLTQSGDKVILTGDFNSFEDASYMVTLRSDLALSDSYRVVHPVKNPNEASAHGFKGTIAGKRIDYILTSSDFQVKSSTIFRNAYDGLYPSDHFAIRSKVCY